MARSREQRRARRAQQQAAEPRAATRAVTQREEARPAPEARLEMARGGFVKESWGELKKVEWPNRPQVLTGTIVVIVAVAIVGAYLWVADQAFQRLVEKVLL